MLHVKIYTYNSKNYIFYKIIFNQCTQLQNGLYKQTIPLDC